MRCGSDRSQNSFCIEFEIQLKSLSENPSEPLSYAVEFDWQLGEEIVTALLAKEVSGSSLLAGSSMLTRFSMLAGEQMKLLSAILRKKMSVDRLASEKL